MDNFIIYRIKFLCWQKKKYSNERLKLLGTINNIMNRITDSFNKNIINQYYFNHYLTKLEEIHVKYKKIYKITFVNLNVYRLKINTIKNDLLELSKKTGMMNITSITSQNFCLDVKDLDIMDKNVVEFVDLVFNPTTYTVYDIEYKNKENTELTIYNSNDNNTNITNDLAHIMKLKNIMFTKLNKKNSLIESINGTRIYISIKIQKRKFALVVDGYFKTDPLNISRYNGFIFEKQQSLIKIVEKLDIDKQFKYGYIEQISIRDFLMYDVNELMLQIKTAYDVVICYKKKNISQIVKEFLNKSLEDQRDLITYFMLCDEENEFQYFAFLLYDMITNESYLLKVQPHAEQIFNSIHWTIQKKFKNIIEKVEDYTKKLLNISDDLISYEKRICLLKASDSVKSKAMEKLKEINNKNSENCSKAQQYLDSLLKIPFGEYRKEYTLTMLDNFKIKLENFIILSLSLINESNYTNSTTDSYHAFLNKHISYCWKYNNIDTFLETLTTNFYQKSEYTLDFSNRENICSLISKYIEKTVVKKIKLVIDTINQYLNVLTVSLNIETYIPLRRNGNKKELIMEIVDFLESKYNAFINDIDIDCLKYIVEILDINKLETDTIIDNSNKDGVHDDKANQLQLFNSLKKEYDIIYNKWNNLKNETADYIKNIDKQLDTSIFGQNIAKNEIKRVIAQWINGENNGYCLGFEGPPGTGKTSLAKYGISNCLIDNDGTARPFSFIALGGSSNGSTLEGHNYTYVGSIYGKIAEILIDSKCMNPIIYIDELDKISNTDNGRELIGILTHLTDSTQNDQFIDKYFSGIPLDLSRVLFIFSYNDYSKIDSILADRIHRVKFDYLKIPEKIHIMNNYLVPKMLDIIGFETKSIDITEEAILYIIKNYTYEAGVRRLKERVLEILRQINLDCIISKKIEFSKGKSVDVDYVKNFFKDKAKMNFTMIQSTPKIGLVNGLFATAAGIGGITVIEAFKTPCETKLSLVMTGQQGDVMKESITCAKTIAWNIIPNAIKNKIIKDIKDNVIQPFGIHIHCPEAATPKDGPSAGAAITLAMVSLLTNFPVNNKIAMTGEIDLNGAVHTIGGLELKIDGGKWAGVEKILVPKGNQQDLDIIKLKNPTVLDDIEIIIIETIWDVLEHALIIPKKEKSKIKFNNYSSV